ncbi:MAG: hypothetical protein K6T65_15285 [Peptococcaceae bacterium]|nr:hypothetical protein [Peptococcaceae bacterium]
MDIKNEPRYAVVRALLDGTIEPEEVMGAYDIFPRLADLSMDVAAFVYRSRKDRFHIIINRHLSWKARQEVLFHELRHIIEDMPRTGYILGLDMKRHEMEIRADMFFREVVATYQVAK